MQVRPDRNVHRYNLPVDKCFAYYIILTVIKITFKPVFLIVWIFASSQKIDK